MAGKGLNKVQLLGNCGKDPELRYTAGGAAVVSFSIATNETWKDKEGNLQEKTEWHNIVAWQRLAEIIGEYVKKGSKVYIEGRLQTRSYEDKEGVKKYVTEIVANDLILLGSKDGGGNHSGPPPPSEERTGGKAKNAQQEVSEPAPAGDLPFYLPF